jgi:hypothetical protein
VKIVSNHALAVSCLLLAGSLLPGCTGEGGDNSSDDAAAVAEADAVIAEGVSSTAIDLVARTVDEFPEWSSGEFAPSLARETSVSWNPETFTWVIESLEEYEDGNVNGVADFTIRVQFRADGTPLQHPNETVDEMEVHLDGTNIGVYTGDRFTVEYDWGVSHELLATRNENGTKTLAGEGSIQGSTVTTVRNRETIRTQDLVWDYDLELPAQSSCATGIVNGTLNDTFVLAANFQGEGVVAWTVTREGAEIASNESTYSCGFFEPEW